MNLVVDCLRRPASFDQLKNIWQTLERLDPLCSPFLSWEFLSRWWQAEGSRDGKLRILVVRRGKEVVAIAPLFIHSRKIFGVIPGNTLMFMGTLGRIDHVHHGVVSQPHLRDAACTSIIAHLPTMKAWHTLLLGGLDQSSVFATLARQRIVGNRKGALEVLSVAYHEVLPNSWSGYKDFNGGFRASELSRISKRLKEVGRCELTISSTREEFKTNQELLYRLAANSDETEDLEDSTELRSLYADYTLQGFLADSVWQVVFVVNGEAVGVQHYSIERGELVLLQAGYSPSVKSLGAANYMFAYAIKRAIDQAMVGACAVACDDNLSSSLLMGKLPVSAIRYTPSLWRRLLESLLDRLPKR